VQNLKFVALPVPEIIGGTLKFGQPLDTPRLSFLQHFNVLLFAWTLRMYRTNLKSVALPVPEIIGPRGYFKTLDRPGDAHAPLSRNFLMGFCSNGPCECTSQI